MAKLVKYFSWILSPFFIGSFLSVFIAFYAYTYLITINDPRAGESQGLHAEIQKLHNLSIDYRLKKRGAREGSENVVILTIDETAVAKHGRWPWPRRLLAKVIDTTIELGAKTLSFDIIFSEKQSALKKSMHSLGQKIMEQHPNRSTNIKKILTQELAKNDDDRILAEVLENRSENLILGAVYEEYGAGSGRPNDFSDYCFSNIAKQKGSYDYWDKEELLLGVTDTTELQFPEKWDEIIFNHLSHLSENEIFNWLSQGDPPLKKYLHQNKIDFTKKNIITLLTQFLSEKKEPFLSTLKTLSPQSQLSLKFEKIEALVPRNDQVDLQEKMNVAQRDYCLYRFLGKDDEAFPQVTQNWPSIQQNNETLANLTPDEAKDFYRYRTLFNPVKRTSHWLLNIPSFQEATLHTGAFNATQDPDGSIRRSRLFVRNHNQYQPNLALKTYLVANDYSATVNLIANPYADPNQIDSKIVKDLEIFNNEGEKVLSIPTDSEGRLPINYAGPQKMFSYLSASELLSDSDSMVIEKRVREKDKTWNDQKFTVNKKEFLKGKSLIFGATAIGIYDLRVTPFEEDYPGVETHANVLDNLFRGDFLKKTAEEEWALPLALLTVGILFSLLISQLSSIPGLLLTISSAIAIYALDFLFIFSSGIVINIIFPFFALFFLYTFLTFFKYFTEERKKKELKGTFEKYVSPSIVNEILKDASKLELGGVKQEMSVFFSDVRGFTTISEKLDPKALSDLLNAYLTPMTEIIFNHNGTLDKYMGDAIMAFFGAPLKTEDHAIQACRSSLVQIEELLRLQKVWESQGLPSIDVGIGVNTGEMSVGNMGSKTVRNYTVMGDAVNLGARLEGINKQYGTRIIISEFTKKHIENSQLITREIDWVKVKGKNEPVRIFELLQEGALQGEREGQIEAFVKGFELYHQSRFHDAIALFNKALDFDANDRVSQLYVERCRDYINNPPSDEWDGVFTMTTK